MSLLAKVRKISVIRITGGEFRSRLLKTPDSKKTKPTMDKVRAAVFSILSNEVKDADVLDLFAGSGSYGLEAISRGAKSATFVDNGLVQIRTIKDNLESLKLQEEVHLSDAFSFLKSCSKKFDIVFADPPYKEVDYNHLVDALMESNVLIEDAIIVLESEDELSFINKKINNIKKYKYGLAKIYILR